MSIIIQCGHELTRSEELITILNEKGLSAPLKSSRTDLSSIDVAVALDRIYKKTSKLIDNKLAESVAIDFLLTNLEIENWGWNSSKNLKALHFWEWLEPDCKFVLVFDHPSEIFRHALKNNLSQALLDNMIQDWIVFQKDLLKFFIDNKNKCVLLEGNAALKNIKATEKYINLIAPEIRFNNEDTMSNKVIFENRVVSSRINDSNKKEMLNNKLLYRLLSEYPELIDVFDCLVENSSIKLVVNSMEKEILNREDIYYFIKETQNVNSNEYENLIDSLKVELSEKQKNIVKLKALLNSSEDFNKEQASLVKTLNKKNKSSSHGLNQKHTVTVPIDSNSNNIVELQKENEIILRQLYLVQKELEYYFNLKISEDTKSNKKGSKYNDSQNVQQLQNVEKSKDDLTTEIPKATPFGIEKRIKMELPYRIGASIIKNSKSRRGIFTIPKAIAMEYIDYNKNITLMDSLPPLEEYGDFDKAKKIKQHLSYQIGEIVEESIKEPKKIITAPIKIGSRVLFFKKSNFIKKKK